MKLGKAMWLGDYSIHYQIELRTRTEVVRSAVGVLPSDIGDRMKPGIEASIRLPLYMALWADMVERWDRSVVLRFDWSKNDENVGVMKLGNSLNYTLTDWSSPYCRLIYEPGGNGLSWVGDLFYNVLGDWLRTENWSEDGGHVGEVD